MDSTASSRTAALERRRRIILSIFLAFILVSSAFAIIFRGFESSSEPTSKISIGGTEFFLQPDGRWTSSVSGRPVAISSHPSAAASASISVPVKPLLTASKVYLSVAPEGTYSPALDDLYFSLKNVLGSVFLSCLYDGPSCANIPLKTCDDAGNGVVVVTFAPAKSGEMEGVVAYNDSCYSFVGDPNALAVSADALILRYYGVIADETE